MPLAPTDKIWLNGGLVAWDQATVHVTVHALHYGTGVFEGIRCYETADGPAIFRLRDHLQRLCDSARIVHIEIPHRLEDLAEATRELVRVNGLTSCYIRPLAFHGYGGLAVGPVTNAVDTAILCFPWGEYLGEGSQESGITAAISSIRRVGPNVIPHAAKATGVYLNSMLATMEARRAGYDEAIMLTDDGAGSIADGPGENIFVVKNGRVLTPPLSTSILPGITRESVIAVLESLGHEVLERPLIRTDLYLADEVFMTGTAVEVTPVRAVDDVEIGVGAVTREVQQAYRDAVHGRDERWAGWLDRV
ncbi:MAG TPA: branched-chain amino acid transaminase [Gaiellaceae bacterium]|nr:branched-chain amino acid transaminase [Gaiellaceae bacterium]